MTSRLTQVRIAVATVLLLDLLIPKVQGAFPDNSSKLPGLDNTPIGVYIGVLAAVGAGVVGFILWSKRPIGPVLEVKISAPTCKSQSNSEETVCDVNIENRESVPVTLESIAITPQASAFSLDGGNQAHLTIVPAGSQRISFRFSPNGKLKRTSRISFLFSSVSVKGYLCKVKVKGAVKSSH